MKTYFGFTPQRGINGNMLLVRFFGTCSTKNITICFVELIFSHF
jgi:hypothetical protein